MSSKSQTNSSQTIQYDPASMAQYQKFQPLISKNLENDMQLDPTKSSTFNLGLQNALTSNAELKHRAASNMVNNMASSGFAGNANAFQQAQLNRMSRAGSSMDAQSVNQNFLNYDMLRRQATGQAMNYRPLQTGQTGQSTTQTSGLGTWLPQVAGGALSFGTSLLNRNSGGDSSSSSGGMSTGAGNAMSNGTYFSNANPFTANPNPFNSFSPPGAGQFGSNTSAYNPFNFSGGR